MLTVAFWLKLKLAPKFCIKMNLLQHERNVEHRNHIRNVWKRGLPWGWSTLRRRLLDLGQYRVIYSRIGRSLHGGKILFPIDRLFCTIPITVQISMNQMYM
jgi:hypothetical protein